MLKFGKKSNKDEEVVKRAQEAADATINLAQRCLRNTDFEKYKKEYVSLGELIMKELTYIDKTETDPVKYGFRVKDVVAKYRHLGALLRGVNADAQRSK